MQASLRDEMEAHESLSRTRSGSWWIISGFGAVLLLAQLFLLLNAGEYDAEAQSAAITVPVSWSAALLGITYGMAVSGPIFDLVFLLVFGCWSMVFLGATALAMRTLQDTRGADRRTTRMLIGMFALGSLAWAIADWENRRAVYGTAWSVALLAVSLLLALTILLLLRRPTASRRGAASLAPALLMQFWLQTVWLPAAPTG